MSKKCIKSIADTIATTENDNEIKNASDRVLSTFQKIADGYEPADEIKENLMIYADDITTALQDDDNARKQASDIIKKSTKTIRTAILESYGFLFENALRDAWNKLDYAEKIGKINELSLYDLVTARVNYIFDDFIKTTYQDAFGYNDNGEPVKSYRKSCHCKVVSTIKQCFNLVFSWYIDNNESGHAEKIGKKTPCELYDFIFDTYKLDKQGGEKTREKLMLLFSGDFFTIDAEKMPDLKAKQDAERKKENREKNQDAVLNNLNLDKKAIDEIKNTQLANGIKSAVAVIQDNPTLFNGVETAKERHPETTSDRVAYILSLIENLTTDERGDLLNALNG